MKKIIATPICALMIMAASPAVAHPEPTSVTAEGSGAASSLQGDSNTESKTRSIALAKADAYLAAKELCELETVDRISPWEINTQAFRDAYLGGFMTYSTTAQADFECLNTARHSN